MADTALDLPLFHSGKVRKTYTIETSKVQVPGLLLVVASDRISTHNEVHNTRIYKKGELLTALTHFWATNMHGIRNLTHIYVSGARIWALLPEKIRQQHPLLHHRAFVIHKLNMIPYEFIYRNFLTGSLFKAYKLGLDPYGLKLPKGLKEMHRFDEPIFTPTDKSDTDPPQNADMVMKAFRNAYRTGLEAFNKMTRNLDRAGITLIDSKFEFGLDKNMTTLLADEFGTMDSSRFLLTQDLKSADPFWLDKQYFRNIVEARVKQSGGKVVPISFSPAEVAEGLHRMHTVFQKITGMPLALYQQTYLD